MSVRAQLPNCWRSLGKCISVSHPAAGVLLSLFPLWHRGALPGEAQPEKTWPGHCHSGSTAATWKQQPRDGSQGRGSPSVSCPWLLTHGGLLVSSASYTACLMKPHPRSTQLRLWQSPGSLEEPHACMSIFAANCLGSLASAEYLMSLDHSFYSS